MSAISVWAKRALSDATRRWRPSRVRCRPKGCALHHRDNGLRRALDDLKVVFPCGHGRVARQRVVLAHSSMSPPAEKCGPRPPMTTTRTASSLVARRISSPRVHIIAVVMALRFAGRSSHGSHRAARFRLNKCVLRHGLSGRASRMLSPAPQTASGPRAPAPDHAAGNVVNSLGIR